MKLINQTPSFIHMKQCSILLALTDRGGGQRVCFLRNVIFSQIFDFSLTYIVTDIKMKMICLGVRMIKDDQQDIKKSNL